MSFGAKLPQGENDWVDLTPEQLYLFIFKENYLGDMRATSLGKLNL